MKLFNNDELVNGQMLPDCWIFFGVINHKLNSESELNFSFHKWYSLYK